MVALSAPGPRLVERVFWTRGFARLWLAQLVQALGDWVGFLALAFLAAELAGGSGAVAIGLVMTARIVPGFLLAPLAGVLVDRWDRRTVMVRANLARAALVAALPFVGSVPVLVVAALVLEALTLLWGPAKDASVPHLVPADRLAAANSLGLVAAYGTFPVASVVFALLAGASTAVAGDLPARADAVVLALLFQAAAFVVSAWLIAGLAIPSPTRPGRETVAWSAAWSDLRDGWTYITATPTVRAVILGLATGLVGGGMLVPLGAAYATEVLGGSASDYGVFVSALGMGVAVGVVAVSALQPRLPLLRVFTGALVAAGVALFVAALSGSLAVAATFVTLMGMAVGPVYVVGFALLQRDVDDELRGRVFGAVNTLVRACVLVSMVLGPFLAALLGTPDDRTDPRTVDLGALQVALPGVRLTLLLAALVIMAAGVVAGRAVRVGNQRLEDSGSDDASDHGAVAAR